MKASNEPVPSASSQDGDAPRWTLVLAYAALYLIWGSTYLAIKISIETMPPFLMATTRFLIAGSILFAIARTCGAAAPTWAQWKHSFIVGAFLIAGGNGIVSFAEKWVDSSMAALIIASNPLFMTVIGWRYGVQLRPTRQAWISLAVGFAGVVMLLSSGPESAPGSHHLLGYLLIVLAILFWTSGSVYSKRNAQIMNPWLQSSMQMIGGGGVCLLAGLSLGEFNAVDISAISLRSWTAFVYLILFGSLAGFTSYVYLLRHQSPTAVSSHAYINPIVAVILGWLILGETLTLTGMFGSALILASVFQLLRQR